MAVRRFARLFDHSIVRPDATVAEVERCAQTAARLGTATLTVQPHYVRLAVGALRGTGVLVGTVVGFPHGNETASMKQYQASEVLGLGAEEIDMVMNIPALKNGERELFTRDVAGVVSVAAGGRVKVILENCYLDQAEKERACAWIVDAGAHFVKTSTAYGAGGATLEDVRLMARVVRSGAPLLRPRDCLLLHPRPQLLISRQDPGTGVPPQNRFIVPGRPARLGLLVPVHRLAEPAIGQLA